MFEDDVSFRETDNLSEVFRYRLMNRKAATKLSRTFSAFFLKAYLQSCTKSMTDENIIEWKINCIGDSSWPPSPESPFQLFYQLSLVIPCLRHFRDYQVSRLDNELIHVSGLQKPLFRYLPSVINLHRILR